MTKFFSRLVIAVLATFTAPALAVSTISLGQNQIIFPSESISADVSVNADVPFSQLDLYVVAPNAPAKSFTITSRSSTWNGITTNPLTISNTDPFPANYPIPASGSSLDLGYSAADTTSNIPPGAYSIETISLATAKFLTPGQYSISTVGGFIGTQLIDASGNNTDLPSATLSLTVTTRGDANLDAHVDLSDLSIVLNHFGVTTLNWTDGNFDNQPTIDLTDLSYVLDNFGLSIPNATAASESAIAAPLTLSQTPEPSSLAIFSAIALVTFRRSWRR